MLPNYALLNKEVVRGFAVFVYCPFHKTLSKSGLWMHWISVRFYEMGDSIKYTYEYILFYIVHTYTLCIMQGICNIPY